MNSPLWHLNVAYSLLADSPQLDTTCAEFFASAQEEHAKQEEQRHAETDTGASRHTNLCELCIAAP